MKKSPLAVLALVGALAVGCAQEARTAAGRSEKQTAEAYVVALNKKDVDALVKLGTPGYKDAEKDAEELVAADGGRGLKTENIRMSHDFGPDVVSARITSTDKEGETFALDLPMSRDDDTWVIPLGEAPGFGRDGKESSSAKKPSA
ncbi:hypothetical protein ACFWH4_16865 [Streptomyces sp. NPDC127091]|uniref:hypothetical protein n=1 Tax=Streptomyces sp. NPDC127091 TaxID=3347134 RepID=UPI00365B1868